MNPGVVMIVARYKLVLLQNYGNKLYDSHFFLFWKCIRQLIFYICGVIQMNFLKPFSL